MTKVTRRLGFGAIDGVVGLAILAFGFLPGSHLHHSLGELKAVRLTLADMAFGLGFIYLWRCCFIFLKLYDRFATIPSRMIATLQGITIVMIPAVAYYEVWHPHTITLRSVVVTFLGLYCYEINRASFSAQFLDRLAARDPRRVVIIGSGRRASKAWRAIRTRYRLSLKLIGFVDDRHPDDMPPDVARRHIGALDLILIAMPTRSCYASMQKAILIAESAGVPVLYLDDVYSTRSKREDPNQNIFRELAPDQDDFIIFLATKRFLDIVGAAFGLIALAPVFLLIAVAIKVTSKGPVFFRQERYGHRRRRFTIFKFRTMVHNAEELLPTLEHANEADGPIFKIKDDPRVLPLGRVLRSTSLDELPQLWNVFVGNMSLVGPRPMSIRDVSLFDKAALVRRFSVRPGMTGLWQVSGRSLTGFDHWVLMDNRYIDRRSLALDIKILAMTLGVVIRRSGAV
jgi:exopolysaccharide biosynthesis polyprenyl glycosylphosphotransferase